MQQMKYVVYFKRKDTYLFVLMCEDTQKVKHRFYFDMTRSHSAIFVCDKEIVSSKEFCHPFDNKLSMCTTRTQIEEVCVDGDNRILQFLLAQKEHYKVQYFWLICEFTGRHTNVILCDRDFTVLEALRHISHNSSYREVRVGKALKALPQPTNQPICPAMSINDVYPLLRQSYENIYLKAFKNKQQNTLKTLRNKQNKAIEILNMLPKYEELLESAKKYANYGGIIFNSLHLLTTHKITSSSIVLQDSDSKKVLVPLPGHARDLQEAGNWYFAQSKRYNKKAKHIHIQIENLQNKIHFLDSQIAFVERFGDNGEIFGISNKIHKRHTQKDLEYFFVQGFKVSIGRNAKDNQRLLESAKADDIWLHIRDVPSAHVIIHCGKKTPPNDVLYRVAQILVGLYVSKKGSGDFVVDWTRRRFVKLSSQCRATYAKHKSISYRVYSDTMDLLDKC